MHKTGEKPGKGTYKCTNCGTLVVLKSDDEALPRCPKCGNEKFNKV